MQKEDALAGMKFRHEMKYLVSDAMLATLKSRLRGIMSPDPHTGPDGTYIIRSLYFDDIDDTAFYDNQGGSSRREKYRIRIYNGSMERISLEKKSKVYDKIRKVACTLTREQYEMLTDSGADKTVRDEYPELLQKAVALYQERRLEPKVIVEYERTPFVYRNGNVRITFDRNLTSSYMLDRFTDSNPHMCGRPVMPTGYHLLEVKYDEFLPDHIYRSIAMPGLQLTSYSKYYLCRQFSDVKRMV